MKKQTLLPLLAALIALPLHAQAVKESDLTPEEKTLFNAAKSKAVADPSYKQAVEVVRTTKIELITKADPTLESIAPKIFVPTALNSNDLPADDKAKWNVAMNKVLKDPALKQADDNVLKARNEAMLKIDPNVKPILDKLYPPASAQPAASAQ